MVEIPHDQIWMVVLGFVIAFILAIGIGANDVANSFGTSVGSKVLTLRQACILACVFETLGAVLLGAKVSDTVRKGVITVDLYKNDTVLLITGSVSALCGSCVWLLAATLLRLPVSATHSIVGATVGFALVNFGLQGINWRKLALIIGSWFISPVLAGIVSTTIFFVCKFFILNKKDALEPGLRFLPMFYAMTIAINLFSVFYDGPEMLHLDKIPLWGTFILSFGTGTLCAIFVRLVIVPWQRNRIRDRVKHTSSRLDVTDPAEDNPESSSSSSSGSSGSNSLNSSRRNSSCEEKKVPIEDGIGLEAPPTGVYPDGANNYISSNMNDIEVQMNELNNEKISALKPKLNKSEDASLLLNEYRFGADSSLKPSPALTDNQKHSESLLPGDGTYTPERSQTGFTTKPSPAGSDVRLILDKPPSSDPEDEVEESGRSLIKDRPETAQLFSFLQILTAVFGAFAHGGNDVSNAIGPLVTVWLLATTGEVTDKHMTPIWILVFGGAGISLGLCFLGRRVIKTMGEDLARITPSSGFCIEIGSALTVLVASNIGIPISTTHCKVGSVVFVGRFRSRENVDWLVFRNIVLAWLVTLPVTGGISAAIMAGLRLVVA